MLTSALDAAHIADRLVNSNRFTLGDLPKDQHGLYSLFDHQSQIRYVGLTAGWGGFCNRIYNKHVTGSTHGRSNAKGRSHKYVLAYGRDAKDFVRKECRAAIVPISGRPALRVPRTHVGLKVYEAELRRWEEQVVSRLRARGYALDWNH